MSRDPHIARLARLNPVPREQAPVAARSPASVELRRSIMATTPPHGRPRTCHRFRTATFIALACIAAAVVIPAGFGHTTAVSAIRSALGFDDAPASQEIAPTATSTAPSDLETPGTSTSSITAPTPSPLPPAVARLVGLMTSRPGGIPEDQLPGAPAPGTTRLALTQLGELGRQIWLTTTDKGDICEIILTGVEGGGGCVPHFESGLPLVTDVVDSYPLPDSPDPGPAYLFGLAKAGVTEIDVAQPDGSVSAASFANSAWYWETAPGLHALRGLTLIVHFADGSTQQTPVDTAAGLHDDDPPQQSPLPTAPVPSDPASALDP
jgi:hypothetical protein